METKIIKRWRKFNDCSYISSSINGCYVNCKSCGL